MNTNLILIHFYDNLSWFLAQVDLHPFYEYGYRGLHVLTAFFESVHHLLNILSDWPACNIPGVENTTIGPGLSV